MGTLAQRKETRNFLLEKKCFLRLDDCGAKLSQCPSPLGLCPQVHVTTTGVGGCRIFQKECSEARHLQVDRSQHAGLRGHETKLPELEKTETFLTLSHASDVQTLGTPGEGSLPEP